LWPNSTGVSTLPRLINRVSFKDGIDLFGVGNLLSLQHAAARLIDHRVSQFTVVGDFLASSAMARSRPDPCRALSASAAYFRALFTTFRLSDELAIFLGLSLVPFLGRQPLDSASERRAPRVRLRNP